MLSGSRWKEMRQAEKLIVTVSPTGNFQGKEANVALPYSPSKIVEAANECCNEGAAIAHCTPSLARWNPRHKLGYEISLPDAARQMLNLPDAE